MQHRIALGAFVALAALTYAEAASAHAEVSPPVVVAKEAQVFTLAVPTEKENATTTSVEFTPPEGFSIDSFVPAAGWKRVAVTTGSGEEAVVQKVTWSGGSVPTGEDATFSFLASSDHTGDLTFGVKQTYSDGSIVDWSGPESSDTPAPVVTAVESLGGSGGTSTLTVVALVLSVVALVAAAAGLLGRSGRPLA
jgi:uncharacterized protein YcnI